MRRQTYALIKAKPGGHYRPHEQQGQCPAVLCKIHVAKSGAHKKNHQGRAEDGEKVSKTKQGFLRGKPASQKRPDPEGILFHEERRCADGTGTTFARGKPRCC